MSASTCRICGLLYVPSLEEDRKAHAAIHKKYARGSQPQKVRDFSKAFGWAVAFNDGGLERMNGEHDPELGKLVVAFSWWSRALANGVPEKDFDRYMDAHLAFADSLVSGVGVAAARTTIQKWERFAG
ncbi:C2H2-type zinc finger protein [Pseudomonas sp. BF-R-01]|uniref:C2H2-type zinc finger protein n=1 Tax=Pseudomonas sp. BF-R-01 TaxID=2832365 RepID=UPI001CBA75A5|nr:C2H2-type zinc finger protein [Pseudomonas sp. BF-R-01]